MDYPATFSVETPERLDPWRPLVQWLMAIPHLIIAEALECVALAIGIVSWFVILFTGKLPPQLASFQVMILRYTARAELYAGFLYTAYPPFHFELMLADPGGSPVEISVMPDLGERDRWSVGFRILFLIPAFLFAAVISLLGVVCWILGFFAVLFTGRWPADLRAWVLKMTRVWIRLGAYALLLTDRYPPFETE